MSETAIAAYSPDVAPSRRPARAVSVELDAPGRDRQHAAVRHRVARVDDQVHQQLFDLRLVGDDLQPLGREVGLDLDLGLDQAAKHPVEPPDDRVQVEELGPHDRLARERQELAGQVGGASGGFLDQRDIAFDLRRRPVVENQSAVPEMTVNRLLKS